MSRKAIFDAVKAARGKPFATGDVAILDEALDRLGVPNTPDAGPAEQMRIGKAGLDLIKASEGLRLQAYRCPADVPTIGYGSTGPHVRMGMTITEAEAEALLKKDLDRFERGVTELVGPTTQGRFDALVSLAFNIGLGALGKSTLIRKHKSGDFDGAAAQFPLWNKGGGRVLPGLVTRRAAEAKLYRGQA
jgi:lysozyme